MHDDSSNDRGWRTEVWFRGVWVVGDAPLTAEEAEVLRAYHERHGVAARVRPDAGTPAQLAAGDRVTWDGSGDARFPRYYIGTVEGVEGGLAYVRDDGWAARSAVRVDRVRPLPEWVAAAADPAPDPEADWWRPDPDGGPAPGSAPDEPDFGPAWCWYCHGVIAQGESEVTTVEESSVESGPRPGDIREVEVHRDPAACRPDPDDPAARRRPARGERADRRARRTRRRRSVRAAARAARPAHTPADLVAAVRADRVVGAGSCSAIDECYTDEELVEALAAAAARTPRAAVRWARSLHRLREDVQAEHDAEALAGGADPRGIHGRARRRR